MINGTREDKKVSNNEILPLTISKQESRLYMSFIYVAIISLLIGGLMGLLQTLVRSNTITLPWGIGYYQILTLHGVVLALVLTTYFIIGFQFALMGKTVGISLKQRKVAWLSFWVMIVGTVMAAITILMGKASVLYTFYAPLKAHPVFYIGLALVIVGSWIAGFVNWHQLFVWKKKHPGEKSPYLLLWLQLIWQCGLLLLLVLQLQYLYNLFHGLWGMQKQLMYL